MRRKDRHKACKHSLALTDVILTTPPVVRIAIPGSSARPPSRTRRRYTT